MAASARDFSSIPSAAFRSEIATATACRSRARACADDCKSASDCFNENCNSSSSVRSCKSKADSFVESSADAISSACRLVHASSKACQPDIVSGNGSGVLGADGFKLSLVGGAFGSSPQTVRAEKKSTSESKAKSHQDDCGERAHTVSPALKTCRLRQAGHRIRL